MKFDNILKNVSQYYGERIEVFGATPKGVDWNSRESQEIRYKQVLRVLDNNGPFSINDYGCGYGGLVEYMTARGYEFNYCGFDISEKMIAKARELHDGRLRCKFIVERALLNAADYTVASGVFNVRLGISDKEWEEYVIFTVERIAELSDKAFAFNMLTKYSDPDHMRSYLYYADPCFFFDYCKTRFSRQVALIHDYPLYEFTMLVKK